MDQVKQIFKKILSVIWVNKLPALFINLFFILSVFAGVLYYFFYVYLPSTTNHGETITVPNLTGEKIDKIPELLENMEFRFEVIDSAYDPEQEPLVVISQNPEKNDQVKLNRKIYLTVNKIEPPMVNFPDIIDGSLESAERILKSVGLTKGKVKFVPDEISNTVLGIYIDGKEITKEEITEGIQISKGTTVNLEVGSGLKANQRSIPEVVGLPVDEAEIYLSGYGLATGHIEFVDTLGVEIGTVIKQHPSPQRGKVIAVGSIIDLWVAGYYPEKVIDENK
ncbi:MAG: PASTA domain-containing protein [Bacteroidota bacterium]